MNEQQSTPRLVKLNIIDVFNEVIEYLCDQQILGKELPRNLQVMDMKFEILRTHLTALGERAIEIKDPIIQARFVAIGILNATPIEENEEKEAPTKGNA